MRTDAPNTSIFCDFGAEDHSGRFAPAIYKPSCGPGSESLGFAPPQTLTMPLGCLSDLKLEKTLPKCVENVRLCANPRHPQHTSLRAHTHVHTEKLTYAHKRRRLPNNRQYPRFGNTYHQQAGLLFLLNPSNG